MKMEEIVVGETYTDGRSNRRVLSIENAPMKTNRPVTYIVDGSRTIHKCFIKSFSKWAKEYVVTIGEKTQEPKKKTFKTLYGIRTKSDQIILGFTTYTPLSESTTFKLSIAGPIPWMCPSKDLVKDLLEGKFQNQNSILHPEKKDWMNNDTCEIVQFNFNM